MTAAKGSRRRRPAAGAARAAGQDPARRPTSQPDTAEHPSARAAPSSAVNAVTARNSRPALKKATENEQEEQESRRLTRVLKSVWTWIGAATAAAAGTVLAAFFLPSSPSAAPAASSTPASQSSGAPITVLIDPSGSGPCGSPQTVVAPPGPVGKSIYGSYAGQPASGGWLNVLVQGDADEPVTIESITAKVISRRAEKPGTVLYSSCQGFNPSLTYVRLDLQASQPTATMVPAPNPTGAAKVIPLPLEVTGSSPAQLYIEPISGHTTVRWSLQVHWERGKDSGILTAEVSNDHPSGSKAQGTVITTVGTADDPALCPDGPGGTWAVMKGQEC